jgi:hypothetical protein
MGRSRRLLLIDASVTLVPDSRIIDQVRSRSMLRAVALGGTALAVGAWTSAGPGRRLDLEAFREGNRERGPAADRFFEGVTELGSIWASVCAAAVVAATGHRGLPPEACRGLARDRGRGSSACSAGRVRMTRTSTG